MSLVELKENPIKPELCESIKEEITSIEEVEDITIKSEPLLESEPYYNVTKTHIDDEDIFTCIQCSQSFLYVELYELHILIHNQNNTYIKKCPCCRNQYRKMDKFIIHIQKHLEKYDFCQFCNQLFFNKHKLRTHVLEHKKNGALSCPYCEKAFMTQKSLTVHIRVHTNERPYKCDQCDKQFKQISSLGTHQVLIHSEGNSKECEICHGKFCTNSSLRRHMKLHKTRQTITCNVCKQGFLNKELYRKHKMENHKKLSGFFAICPECNEEFFTSREYHYHTKVHLPDICQNGGKKNKNKKRFSQKSQVTRNTKVASNEKTRICWFCGEIVFYRKLKEHKNKHLLMTSEELLECAELKKFHCKLCDIVCTSKRSLLYHMDNHTEKVLACRKDCSTKHLYSYYGLKRHESKFHPMSKERNKRKNCFLCGLDLKNINYNRHLNDHLQMTDEELLQCQLAKKYPCKQCNVSVPNKSYLLMHTMSHMPKNYKCQKSLNCSTTLYTYTGLRVHQRSAHDEFTCKLCKRSFTGFQTFRAHNHKTNYPLNKFSKKIFRCAWCPAKFSSPLAITQHYRSHKIVDFRCRICDDRFPRPGNIRNHMYKVHGQKFSTEDCYRYLVNKKVDSAEEAFVCRWCKVGFSTQEALSKHARIHSDNRYKCRKCKTCFTDLGKYGNHVKNNVCVRWLVEAVISEAKDLQCIYCNESFSEYFDTTKHIANNHLEELYQCKFCKSDHPIESFGNHLLKRHRSRRKYSCVGCQVCFVTLKKFVQHRKECIEWPWLYSIKSLKSHELKNENIVINDGGIQEDIVDLPEHIEVDEFGDIVVQENDDASTELGAVIIDCIDNKF